MSHAHNTTAEQAGELVLLGRFFLLQIWRPSMVPRHSASVCRRAFARLVLTRDILGELLGRTAIALNRLHGVVAVCVGFTPKTVTSVTGFSTPFVAVKTL